MKIITNLEKLGHDIVPDRSGYGPSFSSASYFCRKCRLVVLYSEKRKNYQKETESTTVRMGKEELGSIEELKKKESLFKCPEAANSIFNECKYDVNKCPDFVVQCHGDIGKKDGCPGIFREDRFDEVQEKIRIIQERIKTV